MEGGSFQTHSSRRCNLRLRRLVRHITARKMVFVPASGLRMNRIARLIVGGGKKGCVGSQGVLVSCDEVMRYDMVETKMPLGKGLIEKDCVWSVLPFDLSLDLI